MRFARIESRQRELDELHRERDSELAEQKPVLDELHALGSAYSGALAAEIFRLNGLVRTAKTALAEETEEHRLASVHLQGLRDDLTRTKTELETVKNRLYQRDQRRTALRAEQHIRPEEKAAAALERWQTEEVRIEKAIDEAESHVEYLDGELSDAGERIVALEGQMRDLQQRGDEKNKTYKRYIAEYEIHEEQWLEERKVKLARVEVLGCGIAAQEREVSRLGDQVKQREDRVRALERESAQQTEQREGIRFRGATTPTEPISIEVAKTRYETALARFEERFGRSMLEGQIKQAESHLAEMREEHRQQSKGLAEQEIASAAKHPDLTERLEEAERKHLQANSAHDAAVACLATAEADRPDVPAHKQGLGLPPGETKPDAAAEATARRDKFDTLIEANNTCLAEIEAQMAAKEKERQALDASIGARTPHLETLDGFTETASGAMPSIPTDDATLARFVSDGKQEAKRLGAAYEAARGIVEDRIERLRDVTRREEFVSLSVLARDRLGKLPEEELLQRCDEFIQSHAAWQKVLRNEIETLERDKDLVVRALDGVASSAVRLLGKAERASIMPDAFRDELLK